MERGGAVPARSGAVSGMSATPVHGDGRERAGRCGGWWLGSWRRRRCGSSRSVRQRNWMVVAIARTWASLAVCAAVVA
jgi:hypothetical protein